MRERAPEAVPFEEGKDKKCLDHPPPICAFKAKKVADPDVDFVYFH